MYIKLFIFSQAQSQAPRGRRPPGPPIAKSAPETNVAKSARYMQSPDGSIGSGSIKAFSPHSFTRGPTGPNVVS